MLKIYDVMLDVMRELRPMLEAIAARDPNLADQMRRALQSVVLNTAEGMGSRGRNRPVRYHSALGSMREVRACVDIGEVMGYGVSVTAEVGARFDQVIGTLVKLARWRVSRGPRCGERRGSGALERGGGRELEREIEGERGSEAGRELERGAERESEREAGRGLVDLLLRQRRHSSRGDAFSRLDDSIPQLFELALQRHELLVAHVLERQKLVAGVLVRANELVELQMDGVGVAVLGVLNEEHHQERNDRRAGVDDELPGVGEMEDRAADRPKADDAERDEECA